MSQAPTYDVLVIGGGNAALCAAITARETGASVLMLEAAPKEWRGGNSMHTRNLRCMHDSPQDVLVDAYPEEEYWQDLLKVTGGLTNEALARLRSGERIEARACVLAAGGFESNREWLREAWGQNERGEWPADNFLIRGTRFNQGVLLRYMMDAGADITGEPSQSHCVAIDARAPLYDGGICTRIDCVSLALAAALALFLVLVVAMNGSLLHEPLKGDFYAIFPHNLLVAMFGTVFMLAVLALGVSVVRFWRQSVPGPHQGEAIVEAAANVLTLKYMDGGHGKGCNNEDDAYTLWRRRFHHFTFYGFLLCFAATSVATIYHYVFGWAAPYAYTSLPVVLGTVGGIGLLIGPAGLFWMNLRRHPLHGDMAQRPVDLGFIALLFFISLTGLVLLAFRDTAWMGVLLAIHLGTVMALFLTMPYGKFAHGIYRTAALLKWNIEKRQPLDLKLGAD